MSMGLGGGNGVVDSFGDGRVWHLIGFVSLGLECDVWTVDRVFKICFEWIHCRVYLIGEKAMISGDRFVLL